MPGQNDADRLRVKVPDPCQELHAIDSRHAHVGHHDIRLVLSDQLQGLGGIGGEPHVPVPVHAVQEPPKPAQDVRIIIHKQQLCLHDGILSPRRSRAMLPGASRR